jgi:hypothetical protein
MGKGCLGLRVSRICLLWAPECHVDSLPHSPDRWDNLPEAVNSLPGLYANTLTFSAGPRVRLSYYPVRLWGGSDKSHCLVLHRPALLTDRNEDIPLHPNHKLCLLPDGRERGQGERVCSFTHFPAEGRPALTMLDRVLTRPYVVNKFKDGSQCPMIVTPYVSAETT